MSFFCPYCLFFVHCLDVLSCQFLISNYYARVLHTECKLRMCAGLMIARAFRLERAGRTVLTEMANWVASLDDYTPTVSGNDHGEYVESMCMNIRLAIDIYGLANDAKSFLVVVCINWGCMVIEHQASADRSARTRIYRQSLTVYTCIAVLMCNDGVLMCNDGIHMSRCVIYTACICRYPMRYVSTT